jgi:hypothetical protein
MMRSVYQEIGGIPPTILTSFQIVELPSKKGEIPMCEKEINDKSGYLLIQK